MALTVLLASPRSFCAGVERAIAVVEQLLDQRGGPIYVRKQIVHNTHVVADLETRAAVFVDELDAVPDGATVVFSAHGVSPAVRTEATSRGLETIDATCPLVTKVHAEARRFAARGDTVILIGHAGHEEIEGTLGEAPNQTVLVQNIAEVAQLTVADPARVSYLTQTTLAVDETTEIIEALRTRVPALRGPASDDICYATTNRQHALRAVADQSDLVLVVGSHNSSNSLRLVELAQRHGIPSYLIDDPSDIRPEWLDRVEVVGVTAGASAPPRLVAAVIAALADWAGTASRGPSRWSSTRSLARTSGLLCPPSCGDHEPAQQHHRSCGPDRPVQRGARCPGAGNPPVPDRPGFRSRRPSGIEPGHGGVDHRRALGIQLARRCAAVRYRTPGPTCTRSRPAGARSSIPCAKPAACPATPPGPNPSMTSSKTPTPPRCPTHTAWAKRSRCTAAPIGGWSPSSGTAH
jgi:4-hydroxy-3-methylbut-2-en-1-yl diphosphate reductase